MKKILIAALVICLSFPFNLFSQEKDDYSAIDLMLIRGETDRAIDTCMLILKNDSLNPEIYYKLGLAYQNKLPDDKSFACFEKAMKLAPGNSLYTFMVAKAYFNKNKYTQAEPLFLNLSTADSTNWTYAYYLTSIYLQKKEYDKATGIYKKFYKQDSTNYIYLDKLGFVNLRKGNNEKAISYFSKSLAINPDNINAIKNISYLYAMTNRIDTAIQLLSGAILKDSTDMDLYARRAALNFSLSYTKRALDDYLIIMASGDSSLLYIKRAGIGYAYNLEPVLSNKYLLLAHKKDTTDMETMSFLAINYAAVKNFNKSADYYKKIIDILLKENQHLSRTYILLGEALKSGGHYQEAISAYIKSQATRSDPSISLIIANLYDEKLHNNARAIRYYQQGLNDKKIRTLYDEDYIQKIKDRIEALKNMPDKPAK